VLLPAISCFALIAVFPESDWLWQLSQFDHAISPRRRARISAFYKACLQKHCLFRGDDNVYLSKNASFTAWINTLSKMFPTAQQICCVRPPEAVLPSQLSSLQAAMQALGNSVNTERFKTQITHMLKSYYDSIATETTKQKALMLIPTSDLQDNLQETIKTIYSRIDITMPTTMVQQLSNQAKTVKHRKSQHKYTLDQFNLHATDISSTFSAQSRHINDILNLSTA